MKKIVFSIFALLVILIVLAIIITAVFFPTERIRTTVEKRAADALGMPFTIEKISVSWAGIPALKASNIRIGPLENETGLSARIPTIRVKINLFKLLQREVEIVAVDVHEPALLLVIPRPDNQRAGHTPTSPRESVHALREEPSTVFAVLEQEAAQPEPVQAPTLPFPVTLHTLKIKNGSAEIRNISDKTRIILKRINQQLSLDVTSDLTAVHTTGTLSIGDILFAAENPILNVDMTFPLKMLSVKVDHDITGNMRTGDFRLASVSLAVNELPLAITGEVKNWAAGSFEATTGSLGAEQLLDALPYELFPSKKKYTTRGNFSFSTNGTFDMKPENPVITYNGSLGIEGMSLSHREFPGKIDALNASINFTEKTLEIGNLSLASAQSELILTGRVDSYLDAPAGEMNATGSIDMGDMAVLYPSLQETAYKGVVDLNLGFEGVLADPGTMRANGEVNFRNVVLAAPKLLHHPANINGTITVTPSAVTMEHLAVTSGTSDLTFAGDLKQYLNLVIPPEKTSSADFTGRIRSTLLDLNDLLVLPKERKIIKPWDLEEPLRQAPVPPNLSSTAYIELGTVVFGKLKTDAVVGKITLSGGVVALENLEVAAYEGLLNGSAALDVSNRDQASYRGSFQLNGFDSGEFISDFFSVPSFIRGTLATSIQFHGTGLDSLSFLNNLTGEGALKITDGQFDNFEFVKKLGNHLKFLDFDTLSFETITNSFSIKNQRVFTPDMALKTEYGTIRAEGSAGFDTSVAYDIALLLNRETSKKALKSLNSLTQYLDLDIDTIELNVKAGGTISAPKFRLDTSRAEEQLKKEVASQAQEFIEEKLNIEDLKEEGKKLLKKLFK